MEATMDRPVIEARIELLTIQQVADELGVSVQTVWRRIRRGSLDAHRLGPHVTLVTRADLDSFKAGPRL